MGDIFVLKRLSQHLKRSIDNADMPPMDCYAILQKFGLWAQMFELRHIRSCIHMDIRLPQRAR
ncbi:hypothetical protein GCM10011517_23900 [Actibacterium pelagium]|uniref:Uncharacterized protein n=1 Tax=Actibacterium pelagium TaxID=2029103 RepID=A0A917AI71_9RHOB|nr:hypothetical protein GCM10011517_23900 [Actibacterium pelagium]